MVHVNKTEITPQMLSLTEADKKFCETLLTKSFDLFFQILLFGRSSSLAMLSNAPVAEHQVLVESISVIISDLRPDSKNRILCELAASLEIPERSKQRLKQSRMYKWHNNVIKILISICHHSVISRRFFLFSSKTDFRHIKKVNMKNICQFRRKLYFECFHHFTIWYNFASNGYKEECLDYE